MGKFFIAIILISIGLLAGIAIYAG